MTGREIVVLTRLPVPGRVKTRLIPALGAEGAARLHADLVEHTLAAVDTYAERARITTTVWVDGSAEGASEAFGSQRTFAEQPAGDLGERLTTALEAAFARGARATLVIGTDCPRLDAEVLGSAFAALARSDAVIGPASDGGYYLLGLGASAWERARGVVFADIPWSTPDTAGETRARIRSAGLSLVELVELRDVDEPADLSEWEAVLRGTTG